MSKYIFFGVLLAAFVFILMQFVDYHYNGDVVVSDPLDERYDCRIRCSSAHDKCVGFVNAENDLCSGDLEWWQILKRLNCDNQANKKTKICNKLYTECIGGCGTE